MTAFKPHAVRAAVLAALLQPVLAGHAATYTWIGGGQPTPTAWFNPLNWSGFLRPLSADDTAIVFPNSFVAAVNDLQADLHLNRISAFDNGGVGGIGVISGQSLRLSGAGAAIHVGSNGSLAVNNGLLGSTAWAKTGAGTLTLGANNAALSADLQVQGGRLVANAVNALGIGGDVTIAAGATLRSDAAQTLGGLAGAGRWEMNATASLSLHEGDRSFAGVVSGIGGLNKYGVYRQQLVGANNVVGAVAVGAGELSLSGATASLQAMTLQVGDGATASAHQGASWITTGSVALNGGAGGARLLVDSGARFSSIGTTMGALPGQSGSVELKDFGSSWNDSGTVIVGSAGSGGLTIGSSAAAQMQTLRVGVVAGGGNGVVTLSGGGRLTVDSMLTLAESGSGTLAMGSGAQLVTMLGGAGVEQGGTGVIDIADAGTRWTNNAAIMLGVRGSATMTVRDGAIVEAGGLVLGLNAGSQGELLLTGSGSRWNSGSGPVSVGERGIGRLRLENGAVLESASGAVGGFDLASGNARIAGAAAWNIAQGLTVGQGAPGEMSLVDGGSVTAQSLTVGSFGTGLLSVGGAVADRQATLTVANNLTLGLGQIGSLTIGAKGAVSSGLSTVGHAPGGTGNATVSGVDARWTTGSLEVGNAGTGVLNVGAGGLVSSSAAAIGRFASGVGTATVSGGGRWDIAGALIVGDAGRGTLAIDTLGEVHSSSARIGTAAESSRGEVLLHNGRWFVHGDADIGVSNPAALPDTTRGTLRLGDQGRATIDGALSIGSTGLVEINGAIARLTVGSLAAPSGGQFLWLNGALRITGPQGLTLGQNSYFPQVTVLQQSQVLIVDHTLDIGAGTIVAYGGMAGGTLKLGGGQMVGPAVFWAGFDTLQGFGVIANALVVDSSFARIAVSGGNLTLGSLNHTQGFNHRGLIEVEAGRTLALHSAGVAPIGSQTLLGEGATLLSVNGVVMGAGERLEAGGNARVVGDFRNNGSVVGPAGEGQALVFNDDVSGAGSFAGKVRFNQLYSPGNSTAAVSLERLQLADSATLLLELQGDAAGAGFDQVRVSGDALLDGDLLLQFGTGFTPHAGQHFELISWQQHSGQFDDVGISGLGSGLRAELSYGAGGLSLTVSAVPEPESWALLLAGGAWIAALARRRRAGR